MEGNGVEDIWMAVLEADTETGKSVALDCHSLGDKVVVDPAGITVVLLGVTPIFARDCVKEPILDEDSRPGKRT